MTLPFDGNLYKKLQKEQILERINGFEGKLYLEFGGKLFDDYHASRVLPGFSKSSKIDLLKSLADETEIIFCVNADDIEKTKVRADLGISYDMEVLRLIDDIRGYGLLVSGVVITQFKGQKAAKLFRQKLLNYNMPTYLHYPIDGYPIDIDNICSENGFGKNDYIQTTRPLVVITAPGPGSGKLATCLSQMYNDSLHGVKSGYAKFETFPVWNLSLSHPVNYAYEAATADLADVNMIDPFHLEKYGIRAINYNRDVEAFPVVNAILHRITGKEDYYASPTEMGVNMAGFAIVSDEKVRAAAKQEIVRRYYKALCDQKQGKSPASETEKIAGILGRLQVKPDVERTVVKPALKKAADTGEISAAIELANGDIITGRASHLMTATSACILNAIKHLAGQGDDILIDPKVLKPILDLKMNMLSSRSSVLKLDDVLLALAVSSLENKFAAAALKQLPNLTDSEMHCTTMLRSGDSGILRKLNIRETSEPEFPSKDLFF